MTAEYLSAIASLVTAVAWPAVVLLVLLLYRKPVAQFLENLESVILPGGAELRRAVDREAQALIEADPDAAKRVTPQQLAAAERVGELAARTDLLAARQQMIALAKDYERVRAAMPPGQARTKQMEIIATKMRTLGVACEPFLQEFSESASPGERLAAVSVLEVRPHPKYLDWLAQRVKEDPRSSATTPRWPCWWPFASWGSWSAPNWSKPSAGPRRPSGKRGSRRIGVACWRTRCASCVRRPGDRPPHQPHPGPMSPWEVGSSR